MSITHHGGPFWNLKGRLDREPSIIILGTDPKQGAGLCKTLDNELYRDELYSIAISSYLLCQC